MTGEATDVDGIREHLQQGQALLGLLVAAAAALTLVLRGRPVLDGIAGSLLPGIILTAAGAVVCLLGILRAQVRWAVGGSVLITLAPTPYGLGLPTLVDWAIALAGVLGLAVLLQAMLLAREGANLQRSLSSGEDGTGARRDVAGLVERTLEHRVRRSRRTLLAAAGIVAGTIVLTRILVFVLPEALAASLELRSLYGVVLMVLIVCTVLLTVTGVRRLRGGGDQAEQA